MRQLKTKYLIKLDGRSSNYNNIDHHNRNLRIAMKLEEAGLARFVHSTTLAPMSESESEHEKGRLQECTYYGTDSRPALVTFEEMEAIKKAGASPEVVGCYEDERTRYSDIVFYTGLTAFIVWNLVIISKVVGLV